MKPPAPPFASEIVTALKTGFAAHQAGRLDEAAALYKQVLARDKRQFDALHYLGVLEMQRGQFAEAHRLIREALRVNPKSADAYANFARAQNELGKPLDALASIDKAMALRKDFALAGMFRGNILRALGRHAEAVTAYEKTLAIQPELAAAWFNRGNALSSLRRFDEAVESYNRAIALKPSAEALSARGQAHFAAKRFDRAIADHHQILALDPAFPFARSALIGAKLSACAWDGLDADIAGLRRAVKQGRHDTDPYALLLISNDPQEQLQAARIHTTAKYPPLPSAPIRSPAGDKIRIAYCAAEFREHATAYLMAEMFEQHDRSRFEITAVSFWPDDGSAIRARLKNAFDHFLEAATLTDEQVAGKLRKNGCDIAVDLKGYTEHNRTGIFAHRAAPVQVNYLGYPGTMGANYMDYIVADRQLIGEADEKHYTEKVVCLPDTYQCNDSKKPVAPLPSRNDYGLPDDAFVFCAFNNNTKILPETFARWMALLRDVPGSVLWLFEASPIASENLRRAASAQGIAPERLIFARFAPLAEHLSRCALADLFLDTFPYNAHTTASDALYAGLPVLTRRGETFASRVAASLLHAIGLPELVTHSAEEYDALARALATDKPRLISLRETLARNRATFPLFDTARFTRHLEAAYANMAERARRGEAPAAFTVTPIS